MDAYDLAADPVQDITLSYDDNVAYEEQLSTQISNEPDRLPLVNRIGRSKVYLLSESNVARVGKVRWQVPGGVRS